MALEFETVYKEEDLFKYVILREDYSKQQTLKLASDLLGRIPSNIFTGIWKGYYELLKYANKYNIPLGYDQLQQMAQFNMEELLKLGVDKDLNFEGDKLTEVERRDMVIDTLLQTYEELLDSDVEDYLNNMLDSNMELFVQSWANDAYEKMLNNEMEILRGEYKIGSTTYSGSTGATTYHTKTSTYIDSIASSDAGQLSEEIDTSKDSVESIRQKMIDNDLGKEVAKLGVEEFDKQVAAFKKGEIVVIQGGSGTGKSVNENTLLPTPNGWVVAKNVKVGDKLFDRKGKPTNVLGVYPQGKIDCYEVTLDDGRVMLLSGDHLVPYIGKRGLGKTILNKPLKEMIPNYKRNVKNGVGHNYAIPHNKAVQYSAKELTVNPYVLGFLIAEGSLSEGSLKDHFNFSTNEDDLVQKMQTLIGGKPFSKNKHNYNYSIYIQNNPEGKQLRDSIRDLKLNVKSINRFIPEDYLLGSIEQRKQLLTGLMDTDGHISTNGSSESYTYTYATNSKQLAKDVKLLADSLGYGAKISSHERNDDLHQNTEYTVYIFTEDVIVSSVKHLAKLNTLEYRSNKHLFNFIVDIKQVEDANMVCFRVDNGEHLFLMNDYIVTHNTRFATAVSHNGMINYGSNVLFISLEQKSTAIYPMFLAKQIALKNPMLANMTDKDIREKTYLVDDGQFLEDAEYELIEDSNIGRLKIEGRSIYADALKAYLNEVWDSGFKFDIVVLDYIGLIEVQKNRYEDITQTINMLKSECKNFRGQGFLGIVPNQIKSEVEAELLKGNTDLSKLGGAESQAIIRAADYVLTLAQTPEQQKINQMTLITSKIRLGNPIPKINMQVDLGKMYFESIEVEEDDEY